MNKTIENKLLHFFTSGSIYEDFSASRTKKTAKLRLIIRACFYAHCAAAVICIVLAAVLHAGTGIIAVTVCEVVLAALAFLAVGDMTLMKTLLCCGDFAFASAMFVTGAMGSVKAPFFAVGAVTVVTALVALGAFFAATCKIFLEEYSPLALRREHYTILPNLSSDIPDTSDMTEPTDKPDMLNTLDPAEPPEEPTIVLPPKSEFRELADKLKDVFHEPKNKAPVKTGAKTVSGHTVPSARSQTEVTE